MTLPLDFESVLPQVEWPAPLGQGPANRAALLFQLEQSQWWSPGALQEAQSRQLRQLLPHAMLHVPHYRQTLAGLDVARALADPAAWAELPLLGRGALAATPERLRSEQVPREHGGVHDGETSGSTGRIAQFRSTDLVQFFWKAFVLREAFWHRTDFSQRLMSIRYAPQAAAHAPQGLQVEQWGGAVEGVVRTGPGELHHVHGSINDFAARLQHTRPGYVLGHASVLAGLVDHAERHGWRPQGLKGLRSIGETLADDQRERCRRIFGVPLVDAYSCQEAGYLAVQCPDHDHYHVQSENMRLEVLRDDRSACAPGEIGRVVVTTLHNFATPLIRYEVGDFAEVGAPCSCGRGLPVLRRVMGRYRNLVTLPDGQRRWPKMGFEEMRGIAPVHGMQLVQLDLAHIDVRYVAPAPLTAAQTTALAQLIQGNLGHAFALRFERVDDLRNPANGKIEQFISRLPA